MEEHLEFNPSYTLMTFALSPGESVNVEPGAMVAMGGVEMQTRKSGGGVFTSLKKMALGGESFFLNTFTAGAVGGWVSIAPGSPGDIRGFNLVPGQVLYIQGGSYLASTLNIVTDTKFQGAKGFFSGESMFFVQATSIEGTGRVWYDSFGAIKQIPVQPGQTITVDTGHVVAFDGGVQYTINKVGGMKSFLVGGEGLVMNFSGHGNVWIQTRNVGSLAAKLIPFLPA